MERSVHCAHCKRQVLGENEICFIQIRKPNDSLTQKSPADGTRRSVEELENVTFFDQPDVTVDSVTK